MSIEENFYSLSMYDIDGNDFQFSSLKGKKATLIVNVACFCGYTSQYAGLCRLYRTYKDKGLEILAVPCNQFGGQEPGTHSQIKEFVKKYKVTFKVFGKIDVNGPNTHPVYSHLKQKSSLFNPNTGQVGNIPWNFAKFLVNKEATKIQYFPPYVTPEELEKPISKLLADKN